MTTKTATGATPAAGMTTAVRDLRPGDRVVAVNGSPLPVRVVDHVDARGSAWLVPLPGQVTTARLYDDQHTADVESLPAPPTPAPPRRAVKAVGGLRLISDGDGTWATADGRTGVQRESGLAQCDAEHPVRLSRFLIEAIKRNPHNYPSEASWAVRIGAKGYLCPGYTDHSYVVWTVWLDGKWLDDGGQCASMREALDSLAEEIARRGGSER